MVSAVAWLQGTVLGAVATAAAVVAVAAVGFMMLTGRMDMRRSGQVILGCFIIFGAATIANGLMAAMSLSSRGSDQNPPDQQVVSAVPPTVPVKSVPAVSDPYAGAAVPQR
jgi:thiol:disulfide interchange protein